MKPRKLINKKQNLLILVIISIFPGCLSFNKTANPSDKNIEISFTDQWDTSRVLENPDKGWYHHFLDNGIKVYGIANDSVFASFPGMDHLYLRLAWSFLEPQEGKFDWNYIDEVIEKYVPKGYKISFRITCSETGMFPDAVGEQVDGVQYATPSWVEKAGAKGLVADIERNMKITKHWIPEWGDPVFLEKLDQFHKAFASRYDSKSWISYVDIGSIGDWGEGHTARSKTVMATISEAKAHMDIYLKNYRNSQIVVNDDLLYHERTVNERDELYQYAVNKGITIRDDSPMIANSFKEQMLKTWTVRSPEFYDSLYLKKPIVIEFKQHASVKQAGNWQGKNGADIIEKYGYSGAEIMRKVIETMHGTYIGYHGYAEEWLAGNPDLTKELANLCGYWYFPVKANLPERISKGINRFTMEWINKGVAPAYNTFSLLLRFSSTANESHTDFLVEDSGNKSWVPDSITMNKYIFRMPENIVKGIYLVKFKLVEYSEGNYTPIDLGLKKTSFDSEGFVDLVSVVIN